MRNKNGFLAAAGVLILLATAAVMKPSARTAGASAAGRIPVTVRVFSDGLFVGDLTLKDLELSDGGMPVEPEALFLVRKDRIERQEGAADIHPDLSRKITLLFQLTDYHSKIPEALAYLFKEELLSGDSLEIQTPVRNYRLSPKSLASKPGNVLARELTDIVRKDIVQGGMAYNSVMRDLKRIVRQISGLGRAGLGDTEGEIEDGSSLEHLLMDYADNLQKMEAMRAMNEGNLIEFAGALKKHPGRKFLFFFYQREFRPELNSNTLDLLVMDNSDRLNVQSDLQTLFQMYSRSITMNHARLKEAFADSMVEFSFLFLNKPPERISGITMREQSEDVFKALSMIAQVTGGITDTSQNPAASIKTAMKESESYYLLYFTPTAAAPPGKFIDIKVKVKNRDCRVIHRAGYLSRS